MDYAPSSGGTKRRPTRKTANPKQRKTVADLFKEMCLGALTGTKFNNALFDILLAHSDIRDDDDKIITNMKKKRERWTKMYGKLNVDTLCNQLSKLFMEKPYLLEEDLFNQLPVEIKSKIMSYITDVDDIAPDNYLVINKHILSVLTDNGEMKKTIQYRRMFKDKRAEAGLYAAITLFLIRRPSIINHFSMVTVNLKGTDGRLSMAMIRIWNYVKYMVRDVTSDLINDKDGNPPAPADSDLGISFFDIEEITHNYKIPPEILFGNRHSHIATAYSTENLVRISMTLHECFNWLVDLYTFVIDSRNKLQEEKDEYSDVNIEIAYEYKINTPPHEYIFLYPTEVSHFKDGQFDTTRVKEIFKNLDDETKRFLSSAGATDPEQRQPNALLTYWAVPEIRKDLKEYSGLRENEKRYPEAVLKKWQDKKNKDETFTDFDVIEYMFYNSYPLDITSEEKIINKRYASFTDHDCRRLLDESKIFLLLAGKVYHHIINLFHFYSKMRK